MSFTVRVSLPGVDALTDGTVDNYSLYADSDNILIKELDRDGTTLAFNAIATVPHNLGYTPMFLVYAETISGRFRISNNFDPVGGGWRTYAGTDNLYIENRYGGTQDATYYVFYDNVGSAI